MVNKIVVNKVSVVTAKALGLPDETEDESPFLELFPEDVPFGLVTAILLSSQSAEVHKQVLPIGSHQVVLKIEEMLKKT